MLSNAWRFLIILLAAHLIPYAILMDLRQFLTSPGPWSLTGNMAELALHASSFNFNLQVPSTSSIFMESTFIQWIADKEKSLRMKTASFARYSRDPLVTERRLFPTGIQVPNA
jgi:hypothetical protein